MENGKLHLWRIFIIGRSAVTGVLLVLLYVINGFRSPLSLRPLFLVAGVQFAANGIYLYLWRQRDIAFLGYLCFILEITLITLFILALGPDGYVFVLAYLWPIIMGGWLIGHQAILPLTLLSSVAYVLLFLLERSGIILMPRLLTPDGTSQALVLSLPYLAFVALLVWTLTTERERGEEHLRLRNQELRRVNTGMRSLVGAGEEFSSCLDTGQLLTSAMLEVERITGHPRAAVYMSEGDTLNLREQRGLPPDFVARRRCQLIPKAWSDEAGSQGEAAPVLREPLTEQEIDLVATAGCPGPQALTHVALRSPHGVLGMLTIASSETEALDEHEAQMLQILGHQLGIALENARLFSKLQYERNLLSGILANMTEGVFVVDHERNVLLTNRAAANLFHVNEHEALPSWFLDQTKVDPSQSTADGDFWLAEVDGKIVRLSTAELSKDGEVPASTIYVARDITEEAEAQRMKSDFVAYASHELRTPLTTIKMLARLLLMDLPPDTKHHEYLKVINTQVDRQTRLINNLLDLARLEAGKYDLPSENVDPRQTVQSVVSVCLPLADEKDLTINVACSAAPDLVGSNSSGLEQVLTNLVSNAIKFTDPGGQIEISCCKNAKEVLFSVKDSGVGMTPEQLKRIFTRFYTVRNPSKRGEGTGIGLTLSDMIVRKLGGRIVVTSEVGVGSCFVVHLPMTNAAMQQPCPRPEVSRAS